MKKINIEKLKQISNDKLEIFIKCKKCKKKKDECKCKKGYLGSDSKTFGVLIR